MILVCGIPSETPLQLVISQLQRAKAPLVIFNQREFAHCSLAFSIESGQISGGFRIGPRTYELTDFSAVYSRMMDDRILPELCDQPQESELRRHCRGLHDALLRWIEIAPALVINRCAAMASNSSKPYQSQMIRENGFLIPATLITNDPEQVRAFRARHVRMIYKSISAVRSIVHEFKDEDDERLERIRWCPTQFQAFVDGTNVRVHTIGDEVFATAAHTDAVDYRYATRQAGTAAELREVTLSSDLARRCLALSRALGMEFAGIDLKITPDDEIYCFEVNPCPGFSYYELNTGQGIAAAVARRLAHGTQPYASQRC